MEISRLANALARCGELTFMEVCGTHTAAIARSGLLGMLPQNIRLVSGPGCPVCVTDAGFIDAIIEYSCKTDSVILSFGDLVRVRGSKRSLTEAAADGARLQIVYSPLDALALARQNPRESYVLAAVGFETTVPLYALVLDSMVEENIGNIKLCASLKTIIPAMDLIARQGAVDGFICPGHVATVIGSDAFNALKPHGLAMAVAGFEAGDVLDAVVALAAQSMGRRRETVNLYGQVVRPGGNPNALALIDKYFRVSHGHWRGIGRIERSAYVPKDEYSRYFIPVSDAESPMPEGCRCSDVLLGRLHPRSCPQFGKICKPSNPLGPCMVSREGACGVWFGATNSED